MKGRGQKTGKTALKKAKQLVTKDHKRKAKKNMDTFFLKAKSEFIISPSQGATVSNYIYMMFGLLEDWTGGVVQNKEFLLYSKLYDKVRVNSIKATITPKANVFDQANAQNETLTLSGDGVIHHAIDRDGAIPPSIPVITRYPSYRKTSLNKKVTRSYSVKYPVNVWLDAQNPLGNDQIVQTLGLKGGPTFYAENLVEDKGEIFNEPYANVVLEYNCVFQGKTSAAVTYNEDGSICLSDYVLPSPVPRSVATQFSGTIGDTRMADDGSGGITEIPRVDQEIP